MVFRILVYITIGLLAGFLSGLFGIGSGSIRIPLLNFAGSPLLSAYGINLFVIPFSSAVGAYSQRKNIRYITGLYMLLGGVVGSIAGALVAGFIPALALAILFAAITLLSVFGIYLDRLAPKITDAIKPSPANIMFGTLFLNLVTGVRGGSGGSLFPAFLKSLKFDIHEAIATSLFVTIFTAAAAVVVYLDRGNVAWLPALSVLGGSIIGAKLGSEISLRSKPAWLEVGLSVIVSFFALLVIYKSL